MTLIEVGDAGWLGFGACVIAFDLCSFFISFSSMLASIDFSCRFALSYLETLFLFISRGSPCLFWGNWYSSFKLIFFKYALALWYALWAICASVMLFFRYGGLRLASCYPDSSSFFSTSDSFSDQMVIIHCQRPSCPIGLRCSLAILFWQFCFVHLFLTA